MSIRKLVCVFVFSFAAIAVLSAFADERLPAEYQRLVSITSTGTQYIQTGMKPTSTTTVEMDFNTGPYANDTTFFGQSWGNSQYLFIKQSNAYKFYGANTQVSALHNNEDAHLSITAEDKLILDFGTTTTTTPISRTTSTSAFNIFADSSGGHKGSWTLYSMKIWTDGVLMRDYVPAERKSDGVIGLYDRANDVFYTNSGTDAFVAGPCYYEDLVILPIPDQINETFEACRPEFVVSNLDNSATWTIGGDIVNPLFDVTYTDIYGAGKATVTVVGQGEYEGRRPTAQYNILATKLEDENVATSDTSARRLEVDGKSVYVFKDATSAHTVTAKRNLFMADCLLVGGGGGGGCLMGGGGGGGGVGATEAVGCSVSTSNVLTVAVGAGGVGGSTQAERGTNGSATSLDLGSFTVTVPGGGGGGTWSNTESIKTGANGASGGGGSYGGAGGAGIFGFGFAGAASLGANNRSGGGGGAGHAGYQGNATANHAGYGGEGVSNNITGAWVVYGGGGGAGGSNNGFGTPAPGLGGLGGGGDGSKGIDGNPGVDGLGGGGGGGGYGGAGGGTQYAGHGGEGGSGAVILALTPIDFGVDAIPAQYIKPAGCFPEPVVRYGETLLVKDTDYTVAYANNTAPGMATITITGINTYVGKVGYAVFEIRNRLCAKPEVVTEGDGSTWDNAMSWTNALATAAAESGYVEIWLSGDVTLDADPGTLVFSKSMVVRGGFAGTEVAPDERVAGAMSTFNGQVTNVIMTINNTAPVVLDGLRIFNGKRGIVKTGSGDITIVNSAIVGNMITSSNQNGYGLGLTGTDIAKLVISNCVISGNATVTTPLVTNLGQGQGLYAANFGSVLITYTTFLTNGLAWTAADLWNEGRDGQKGAAICLNNAPATISHCVFRGNRGNCYSDRGGIVRITGTGGGTLIDHCVFAGNEEDYHWFNGAPSGGKNGGQIVINLSTEAARVTIDNCTIAGNLSDNPVSSAGITVTTGTAVIKNSIIANNFVHPTNTGGEDLALVDTTAHAEVSYSVLSADGPSSYSAVSSDNLLFGAGMRFGDPELVSSASNVEALLVFISSGNKLRQFDKTKLDEVLGIDVHPLSPTGYFTNDGTEHVSGGEYSLAIDAGNPIDSVGDEPSPNGGIVNAGAYGGTAQASKTPSGEPAVSGDVTVSFEGEYSQPTIRFAVGGSGVFFAQANVFVTTNDVDWVLMATYDGLSYGDSVECLVRAYYAPGYVRAKVTLSANESTDTATSEATSVTKPLPPWWGKGGPANVIHVRPGAIGLGSGDNWSDAVPELRSAFSLVSADKNEIWIAGTNVLKTGSVTLSTSNPLVIRGGFHGWEESVGEREEGFRSVIDGDDKTDCLTIANSAAVEVERIYFTRGLSCGLIKSGAGDMRVSDCHFFTNGMDQATDSAGKGARVSGTKTTTVVTFTNCVFRCNRAKPGLAGGCTAKGGGINGSSLKCLRLEDCYFVHNGIHLRAPGGGNSAEPSSGGSFGSAVYSTAPVSAVGCRFVANFGNVRYSASQSSGYGGVVRLHSGAEGSAFTNCVWAANGDQIVWQGTTTEGNNAAGALVVNFGSASGTVDVERCTFAYNLADGYETTAGLNLILGTANVHNSIFFGNILGGASSTRGRDISLRGTSVCNVSYTLFGELGADSVTCADTATTNFLDGIVEADPLFVTEYATMTNLVKESTSTAAGSKLIFWDWATETADATYAALENASVHLRGGRGYFDEKTGLLVAEYCKAGKSPAIDTGDPESDYRDEPNCKYGYHGHRVNLGAYGNTPWATMSANPGFYILLR